MSSTLASGSRRSATLSSFDAVVAAARGVHRRVAVAAAADAVALAAVARACELGIAAAILVGDERAIRATIEELELGDALADASFVAAAEPEDSANAAVALAAADEADMLLKGRVRTDQLLHAALAKTGGLRTGRLLSDVLLYEDNLGGDTRLVGVTDGGINVAPTLDEKRQIVLNAVGALHRLGVERPKIAIMSATEIASDAVPSTRDAEALTRAGAAGELGDCEVYGPLALDNALVPAAAAAKGISSPVAGAADCMVVPSIEAGNLLGKSVKWLGGARCGHVVVGAKVPILIPSRVEDADDKLNSIALGAVTGDRAA